MNDRPKPNPIEVFDLEQTLPESLPAGPMALLRAWFDEARERAIVPNPDAMTLATADDHGAPSARIVLCKRLETEPGCLVFHTNRRSRKGRDLAVRPQAAAVFHWDVLGRQARIEGPVTLLPDDESDAYFASRSIERRLGAWASRQSEPVASREELLERVVEVMQRFGVTLDDPDAAIPRPPHWGGYRLWAERVELWLSGPGRVHDRAEWRRELTQTGDGFTGSAWVSTRLSP